MHGSETPWWNSLTTRTTLLFLVLLVTSTLLAGLLVYRGDRDGFVEQERAELVQDLDLAEARISSFIETLGADIEFLSRNDQLTRFVATVHQGDSLRFLEDRERVALLFSSLIQSRPSYAQVRFIANDSAGMELVRFDRNDERVTRTVGVELQSKGGREYFRQIMRTPAGQVYFSRIDLNKERGRVSRPFMPTLRAAAALVGQNGQVQGAVVINADLRPLFQSLAAHMLPHQGVVLARSDGELLLHPDTSLTFRSEFGGTSRLGDMLDTTGVFETGTKIIGDEIWAVDQVHIPGGPPLLLCTTTDTAPFLAELRSRRARALTITSAVAALFAVLALFLVRTVVGPLRVISQRIGSFANGEPVAALPVTRKDEVGELARSFQQMQQRIDQRVKEVKDALSKAKDADRQRRDLVANMSHEVRTPLNAILGMSDALGSSGLSEADGEKLSVIQRSASRLLGLVDDLLVQARLDAGRIELRPRSFDPMEVLKDLMQAHRPGAQRKGLALRLDAADIPERFVTDPLRLHQVLDNLVGNAIKFTTRGQVDLRVRSGADPTTLEIIVEDTGPGIPEDAHLKVFERFEHARDEDGAAPGAGLGLAITRQLVASLQGTIEMESEVGRGTRFRLLLPALQEVRRTSSIVLPDDLTAGIHVLYVEDVYTNRMLMEQFAERFGWQLTVAEDPAQAIASIGPFDLMLIDLDLGEGMGGHELAARLRGLTRFRHTPMIAVTAFTDPDKELEALKAGMNDRITKPIDRDRLLRKAAFWTDRWVGDHMEEPDLNALGAQFDHDTNSMRKALRQYRKEFATWRIELEKALQASDPDELQRVQHRLTPHFKLLGLSHSLSMLADLDIDIRNDELLDQLQAAFLSCERAFLKAMCELDATTGPGEP
ncbi:MAG: response regulator [Flavobacteriales bacterium]|nr:response regulator [Flavobacteriales bacterium]